MKEQPRMGWFDWRNSFVLKKLSGLRIEEVIAYVFFVPCLAITFRANFHLWLQGFGLGRRIESGLWRIAIVSCFLPLIPYVSHRSETSTFFARLRKALPFALCLAIYTNLHDTIHFVNPHDVQQWLIKADVWLFGVEPTLWAQQFYSPWLTELFSFCYASYLPLVIVLPVVLYVRRKDTEARTTLLGLVLCFYWGYFLYILFPAVPPRLAIADQYTRSFEGGLLLSAQMEMVSISETSSRAAFPSLHAAITLLTLIYSWRFERKIFWLLLPLGTGLIAATIYLRHHYVVDLLAGFPLGLLSYRYSPAWDRAWERLRMKLVTFTTQP